MAIFGGTAQKCKACEKTVYLVDQLTTDDKVYHKSCFGCHHCKRTLKGRKRGRSPSRGEDAGGDAMDVDVDNPNKKLRMQPRSMLHSRSQSRPPGEVVPGEGFRD